MLCLGDHPLQMGRSNQTAKTSTRGRAPRKELQTKAARKRQGKRDPIPKTPLGFDIEWLRFSDEAKYGKRQNFFLMKSESKPEPAAITAKEFDAWFDDRFGEQIREFMKNMAWRSPNWGMGEALSGCYPCESISRRP